MRHHKIFAIFTSLSLLASAASAQTLLPAGVPFTPSEPGYFFTLPQEKQIRYRLVEADYFEKKLGLQDSLIRQLSEQSDINNKLATQYQQAYQAQLSSTTRSKVIYFALGALSIIAGGIALGYASHALK